MQLGRVISRRKSADTERKHGVVDVRAGAVVPTMVGRVLSRRSGQRLFLLLYHYIIKYYLLFYPAYIPTYYSTIITLLPFHYFTFGSNHGKLK